MKESRDPAEAAERIMQLCVARDKQGAAPPPPARSALSGRSATTTTTTAALKREKRTRFMAVPDEIIG
ncbi:unnamed protein product [Urochloa humidicola]